MQWIGGQKRDAYFMINLPFLGVKLIPRLDPTQL